MFWLRILYAKRYPGIFVRGGICLPVTAVAAATKRAGLILNSQKFFRLRYLFTQKGFINDIVFFKTQCSGGCTSMLTGTVRHDGAKIHVATSMGIITKSVPIFSAHWRFF